MLGCTTRGGIWGPVEGNWIDPTIRGVWTRSGCRGITTSRFMTLYWGGGGRGGWLSLLELQ